jgi:hypothetical protein
VCMYVCKYATYVCIDRDVLVLHPAVVHVSICVCMYVCKYATYVCIDSHDLVLYSAVIHVSTRMCIDIYDTSHT